MLGCGVAHLLERVAAVAEVARPVRHELQLAGLHFGPVLCGLQVAQFGREAVDGAVEAADLGVHHVDEPPQQGLALVGELEAVGGGARGEDGERFAHRADGLVAVPYLAGVELAALGGGAEELRVLANRGGHGLALEGVDIEGHGGGSLELAVDACEAWVPRCAGLLGHARAGEPPGPE